MQADGIIHVKSSVSGYDRQVFGVISFGDSCMVLYCFVAESHANIILSTRWIFWVSSPVLTAKKEPKAAKKYNIFDAIVPVTQTISFYNCIQTTLL